MGRILGVFVQQLRKPTITLVMSVRPFAWNSEDNHRTFIRGTSYLVILLKCVGIFRFRVQSDMNNRNFALWPTCIYDKTLSFFLFTADTDCSLWGMS
jgi:hypothetical protein